MDNILKVKNLTSGYGKLNIIREINFTMNENIGIFLDKKVFLILAFTIVASNLGLDPINKIKSESSIPLIVELNK